MLFVCASEAFSSTVNAVKAEDGEATAQISLGGSPLNHYSCLHNLPPSSICLWLVDSKSVRAFLCVALEAFIPSVKTLHSHF